ncbi:hypothetical protein NDU88_003826 [Pleurodeles waltl]|uniref:Uncharacterized protein n=1 Tax=Pleurodeles waltl TaxID=8319 RepID=A0AAV7SH22_PLEWA|nr:hypothetical protein NDU88_003826 [Pleurodeles waltl]
MMLAPPPGHYAAQEMPRTGTSGLEEGQELGQQQEADQRPVVPKKSTTAPPHEPCRQGSTPSNATPNAQHKRRQMNTEASPAQQEQLPPFLMPFCQKTLKIKKLKEQNEY